MNMAAMGMIENGAQEHSWDAERRSREQRGQACRNDIAFTLSPVLATAKAAQMCRAEGWVLEAIALLTSLRC